MKKILLKLQSASYPILAGSGLLPSLPDLLLKLNIGTAAIVITNPLVNKLYGKALAAPLLKKGFSVKFFEVEDSEKSKSAQVAFDLIGKIVGYAVDKKPFIIAFGGGVVGDLAGFVAAIYKRGIPFIQVPTTLLAQVDSSIGGKVAVDLPQGKNLAGAFYQPRMVLADADFLSTLDIRQLRSGLAEVVKYGIIKDAKLFACLEKHHVKILQADPEFLSHIVWSCAAIKARVVEQDEKDVKNVRVILNFGHTVGHAIENAGGYDRYNHGEAVALGIRAACSISCQMKLMKALDMARVETLLSAIGLPDNCEGVSEAGILQAMRFDKKFAGKSNRFVLCNSIGKVVCKEGIPDRVIKCALDYLKIAD